MLLKSVIAAVLLARAFGEETVPPNQTFVAHEWGTFTSVAGADGSSVQWAPLSGQSDLPCFVNRLTKNYIKLAEGLVRMETPVLYFYTSRSMALSVHVGFPQGWITEWYPQATQVRPDFSTDHFPRFGDGGLDWDDIQLMPGEKPAFPSSQGASRYYAARNTDSTPLGVGDEREKLIFYRGMANFPAPLEPVFRSDGKVAIRNTGSDTIPLAILFENRNGKVGYRIAQRIENSVMVDPPELNGTLTDLRRRMVDSLVEFGLYRKEALAMLETWHDSWFEEGTRVFYIVPRSFVDSQLPLTIGPNPAALVRVFVGRVEMLSPSMEETITTALSNGDVATLAKFGRFLEPFVTQIEGGGSVAMAPATQRYFGQAREMIWREFYAGSCVK